MVEFNEKQFHLSVILILNYLINNGHNITQKAPTEPVNIVFQVHRGEKSASSIFRKAINLISECSSTKFIEGTDEKGIPVLKSDQINISFRSGAFKAISEPVYEHADILFSHS